MRDSYIIPKNLREEIIRKSISVAESVAVDELDCSKSFCRRDTDKTVEEVIQIALKDKKALWNFIYRQGHGEDDYYDVGCSTISCKPDYFLWIKLNKQKGDELILEYNLKGRI